MKYAGLTSIAIGLLLSSVTWGQVTEITRIDFAIKLATLDRSSTRQEVADLLGTAGRLLIVAETQPIKIPAEVRRTQAAEVWYYGTNDISDFPTLGQVHFDVNGNVIVTYGSEGVPINTERITEEKLREYLRLLHSMPQAESRKWNPAIVVRIVNTLCELGKDDGLALIEEFVRISPPSHKMHQQVVLLLRLIFEVPEETGHFPESQLGIPHFGPPKSLTLVPRFPVHLLNDKIPVLMVSGYSFVGAIPHAITELEWYKINGEWRHTKLEVLELSVADINKLKEEAVNIVEQYLDSPKASLTINNVVSQLERLKKLDETNRR